MITYLQDEDFTLYHGDALEVLRQLPDESVHMCVTSPPFYGLRDYGTGSWEDGDEGCDHTPPPTRFSPTSTLKNDGRANPGAKNYELQNPTPYRDVCGKCGAQRVDRQIGLEPTPDEWVAALVGVFREVRRVLRSDGTLWVEVGDSYAAAGGGGESRMMELGRPTPDPYFKHAARGKGLISGTKPPSRVGVKQKDLIGAPWLLAFALRADGWYLRSDVVWARPNPMPESVRDRPTKSHSYVFLLSKSARYFFDQEAIREPHQEPWRSNGKAEMNNWSVGGTAESRGSHETVRQYNPAGRNVRSVWTIPTEPLPDEHYAAFPQKLVERCVLAGTSERGVCSECGAPWQRIVERGELGGVDRGGNYGGRGDLPHNNPMVGHPDYRPGMSYERTTTGWQPGCVGDHAPVPAVVLDPFMGSGTTALVARRLGRRAIGVELSESYCAMAARRTRQLSLLATEGTES